MLRRNASDSSLRGQKIPIRPSRPSRTDPILVADRFLRRKYLDVSVGAFQFRHAQKYLQDRTKGRELQALCDSGQHLRRLLSFSETRECIKGVVTERVEKDYLFGIVFHSPFFPLLEKYQRLQRRLKQRNLYNRYYFSSCPPKISFITQPTATTLRPPETNSTLQLQALTKNLQAMLAPPRKAHPIIATPQKRMKDKSEKRRGGGVKTGKQEEENYGLRNYRKGAKLRVKAISRDKESLCINIKYCVTPQPHSTSREKEFLSPPQGRLSQRKIGNSRSGEKRQRG